ncbi:hypothetical protein GCM10008090_27740 [Arenicella chitinivorans]|uniref:Uncharacterized protein n=1 Tax=Arenicella chitinivorans TaxID=1329800 RepID=A0A918RZ70_9GAMM|nr:hypothetical protein [Arenicella chitinivorans]GHA16382.1 hypothetical protein GCM10008090_27740 [Arenicella chitinivorans]
MTKEESLKLMHFPNEWLVWDMYPDELFQIQISGNEVGYEDGSDHDRTGVFHWWLKRNPSSEKLILLAKLTLIDPDPLMGQDVRSYIAKSEHCNESVNQVLQLAT